MSTWSITLLPLLAPSLMGGVNAPSLVAELATLLSWLPPETKVTSSLPNLISLPSGRMSLCMSLNRNFSPGRLQSLILLLMSRPYAFFSRAAVSALRSPATMTAPSTAQRASVSAIHTRLCASFGALDCGM